MIEVRKTTMISSKKKKSMKAFKTEFIRDYENSGSKASSIGKESAFHVAIIMTK